MPAIALAVSDVLIVLGALAAGALGMALRQEVGKSVRQFLSSVLAWAWWRPLVWLLLLAAVIVGSWLALNHAQDVPVADRPYWAEGIAATMLVVASFLVFTSGRQRSIAIEDITWETDGPRQRVEKGKTVTAAVRDLPGVAAHLNTKRFATDDLTYKDNGKTVQVEKGAELPAGATGIPDSKYREVYVARRAFSYKPKVVHTVKAKQALSNTDAKRSEAEGKTETTRGLAFMALIMGKDGRVSTSKLQALLWTYAVLFGLLSLYLASTSLGVGLFQEVGGQDKAVAVKFEKLDLPPAYYLLLGGPFAAAILAKAFTASKVASGDIVKTDATGTSGVADGVKEIVSDDEGRTDLVDTQYFLFSLLALGYFFASFIPALDRGFPEVPEVLLGLTSASALTYVTKKAVERSVPSVASVVPQTVVPGGSVEVWGSNLVGADRSPPQVQFGGLLAESVEVLGDAPESTDHLRVQVPRRAAGVVKLVVTPTGGKSTEGVDVNVEHLKVTKVEPETVRLGGSLVITGEGFAEQPADNTVTLDDMDVDVVTAAPTKLSAKLRAGTGYTQGDTVMLKVSAGEQSDAMAVKVVALEITEVRPPSVPLKANQTLTVLGSGFGREPPTATLGGQPLAVGSVTDGQIVCELMDAHLQAYVVHPAAVLEVKQGKYSAQAEVNVVGA